MIVSDSKKFIFIHIPKCAGNTIRAWLRQYDTRAEFFWGVYKSYLNADALVDLSHINIPFFRTVVGRDCFDEYFKFAVCRNPYDRAYSAYVETLSHNYYPEYKAKTFQAFMLEQLPQFNFNQFKRDGIQQVHFSPQFLYLLNRNGKLVADKICHIDNLEQELREIAQKLDLEYPDELESLVVRAPQTNKRYQYMDKFDTETIQVVNRIYRRDFELLGFPMLHEPLMDA